MQALDRVATPIVWSTTRTRNVVVIDHACVLFGRYADPLAVPPPYTDRATTP